MVRGVVIACVSASAMLVLAGSAFWHLSSLCDVLELAWMQPGAATAMSKIRDPVRNFYVIACNPLS
jgi:hypothetical protein